MHKKPMPASRATSSCKASTASSTNWTPWSSMDCIACMPALTSIVLPRWMPHSRYANAPMSPVSWSSAEPGLVNNQFTGERMPPYLMLGIAIVSEVIAYAIWSGLGIVLISVVAYFVYGQTLDAPAIIGMALILAGVLVLNLFSKSTAH